MYGSISPKELRTVGRAVGWVLAGVILVCGLGIAWIGVRGALAYQHLANVQAGAQAAATSVASDPSGAGAALARLASDAVEARELTSDPVWTLAEGTPWVGPQLAAFGTVAASSDQLLRESLLPLATAAKDVSVESFKPVGGRIETERLTGLVQPAQEAATKAREAASAIDDIDRTPLLGATNTAVDKAGDLFGQVADAVDGLSRASQLLPEMLGRDGPRNYLLLVQNNAEWRSLGGITGTAILMRADQGSVSMVETQSATSLSIGITGPVVDLPDDVKAIYDTRPARYFHNLTQIPDFTVDGPLAREMYRLRTGVEVDGVLAVDPVALSYLLKAIGPLTLPTGDTLTADNAVPFLLNEVYLRYSDPAAQDAVFASASGAVFQGLLDGRGSASDLISALARASDEHRILLWSADPAEQKVIDGAPVAGQLPSTGRRTARFGVFLNDGTGSKMSYYVRPEVSLTWDACGSGDVKAQRQISMTISLTNTAPTDAATSLPWYITGGGIYGVPPGVARVVGNVYLPEGFELVSAGTTTGSDFTQGSFEGRQVMTFGADLAPGVTSSASVTVRATSTASEAEAFVTPSADPAISPIVTATCGID